MRIVLCNVTCNFIRMTTPAVSTGATKLANAPLVHVLAQVRYAPVLTISKSIPVIQEKLKGIGFPRFEKGEVQSVVFKHDSAPQVDRSERWDFLSRDKTVGVVLTPSFVLLQTTAYDTFHKFAETLLKVFEIVASEVQIDIVERLGIRYVDVVRLQENESFSDYLKPGLVGFPFSEVGDESFRNAVVATVQSAAVANIPDSNSTLNVKCSQVGDGTFLPPDVGPSGLKYEMSLNPKEVVIILDFDHFKIVDDDFAPQRLVAEFDRLHQIANMAFRAALKRHAYDKWGGRAS
jgi:uncharacterized protein (TIGR04255 family)